MNYFSKDEETYILKYEILFSSLIENNFSYINENAFITFIKDSLKNVELKDFIISSLIDKIKIIQKVILPTDKIPLYTYNQFVRSLCKLKSYDVINSLESYLIKNNEIESFFILLQEKINYNLDIESTIDSFCYVITKLQYKYSTLNKFLKIISKDHKFLVSIYLQGGQFFNLKTYITTIATEDVNCLDNIIPIIIDSFQEDDKLYYDLMETILYYTNKYFGQMIKNYSVSDFEDNLQLSSGLHYNIAINYCRYLLTINEKAFKTFESDFLNKTTALSVYNYSVNFELADQRQSLLRLLSFEDNSYAILFIKRFPKYKNLMPML